MIKKSTLNEVSGWDEVNTPTDYSDVNLCLKLIEKGYKNIYAGKVEMYHFESKSRGKENLIDKNISYKKTYIYMRQRFGKLMVKDKYHPIYV